MDRRWIHFLSAWLILIVGSAPETRAFAQDGGPGASAPRPQLGLYPDRAVSQLHRTHWTRENGLPSNQVLDVLQDERGYVWMATQSGLVRFNGHTFRTYSQATTPSLRTNQITVLEPAAGAGFWVGTRGGGLARFHDGRFRWWTRSDGLGSNAVEALYETPEGTLWIGTDGGLSRLADSTLSTYTTEDGLPHDLVLALGEGWDGHLWIGTRSGLVRWRNGRFEEPPTGGDFTEHGITSLHRGPSSSLWIGTLEDGVYRVRGGVRTRFSTSDGLSSNAITRVYADEEGTIWIGTYDAGLNRIYRGDVSRFTDEEGLPSPVVKAIYQDREGSLWIGMHNAGALQLRGSKFYGITPTEGLPSRAIYAVLEDRDGYLWMATADEGLVRYRDGSVRVFDESSGLPSDEVLSLWEAESGALWVGMREGGLCRRWNDRFQCFTREDGLAGNDVFAIYQDASGVMWIGTSLGLSRYDGRSFETYDEDDGLSGVRVTSIAEDPSGGLWVGTYTQGVNRIRGGAITAYTDSGPLPGNQVIALHTDPEGRVWIGTTSGLCRFDDGSVGCVDTEDGLFSNDVVQLQSDGQGQLWIGSLNGLGRASTAELESVIAGRADSVHLRVYGPEDGLPSAEMNGGNAPNTWRTHDDRLLFVTQNGVAVTRPARLPRNHVPPTVVIEGLLANGKRTVPEDSTSFQPGVREFEFRYAGLSYAAHEGVSYTYRLRGFRDTWTRAHNEGIAHYTNLDPGTYTFEVRARNQDGVWSEEPAALTFTVEPYFYETSWFYLFCILSTLAAGWGIYRYRTQRLRRRKEEMRRAKEKAEESARLKTTILHNVSHELRTPLSSILGFAETLEEETDETHAEFATLIRKSGERLLNTVDSVLDLARIESGSLKPDPTPIDLDEKLRESAELFEPRAREKGLDIRTEIRTNGEARNVPLDEAFVDRILDNLIGNAVKFTEEGSILVRMTPSEDQVLIQVEDTGPGIAEEFLPDLFEPFKQESSGLSRSHAGTGLGLAITRQLVEKMDGSIEVESEKGTGTRFTVRLPARRAQSE